MTLQKLIPQKESDWSNLSEEEKQELYYLDIMYYASKRFPRKLKKLMKKLRAKTITVIKYYTQSEIDDMLPF